MARTTNGALTCKAIPELDITSFFETYSLTVFNRWGQLMHEAKGGGQRSWNARDAAAGTYYYTVTYRATCGADPIPPRADGLHYGPALIGC